MSLFSLVVPVSYPGVTRQWNPRLIGPHTRKPRALVSTRGRSKGRAQLLFPSSATLPTLPVVLRSLWFLPLRQAAASMAPVLTSNESPASRAQVSPTLLGALFTFYKRRDGRFFLLRLDSCSHNNKVKTKVARSLCIRRNTGFPAVTDETQRAQRAPLTA